MRLSDNGLPSVDRTAQDIERLCGFGDRFWWALVPFLLCVVADVLTRPMWHVATPLLMALVGAVLRYTYPREERTR